MLLLPEKPYRLRSAQCCRLAVVCPLNHNKGTCLSKDGYKTNRRSRLYATSHIIAKKYASGHLGATREAKALCPPPRDLKVQSKTACSLLYPLRTMSVSCHIFSL